MNSPRKSLAFLTLALAAALGWFINERFHPQAAPDRQAEAAARYSRAAAIEKTARGIAESTTNAVLRRAADRLHEETEARAGSAMIDSLEANIDAATHVVGTFADRDDADAVAAALREAKVWAMVQFGMGKDAPPVFRVQMMPKDLGKIGEDLRARLQKYQPSGGWNFAEAQK